MGSETAHGNETALRQFTRRVHPATIDELRHFDRTKGNPVALSVLRKKLGVVNLARVLASLAMAMREDPLKEVSREGWPPHYESLVRRQLKAALRLELALARALPRMSERERAELVAEVTAEVGGHFIAANIPIPSGEDWLSASDEDRTGFLTALALRLFNAEMTIAAVGPKALGFDVVACRFVQLCHAVGKGELARAFCEADARYFRDETRIRFARTGTLATGAGRCDFRFEL